MKKLFFSFIILLLSFNSKADQYVSVPEDYAIIAVEILNDQSDVIAWCDCCGEDYMRYVMVEEAFYEYTGEGSDCYVFLSGIDQYGETFYDPIDLAYIFIADGDEAVRLSSFIGLESQSCSEYIGYYDAYPFYPDFEQEYSYDEELYNEEDLVYEDYVSLLGFECGDFCHLMYIDSEGIETSGIIDESILPVDFLVDSEYGYIMSSDYDGMMARIEFTSSMIDYGDTSYPELVITYFELIE
jgi:hypothetical protein